MDGLMVEYVGYGWLMGLLFIVVGFVRLGFMLVVLE